MLRPALMLRPAWLRSRAASDPMATKTFIEAIRETLVEEMRRDPSMIVLGEDVGRKGGVFLATDGLYDEFGADRVIDTPLTESMIAGVSIGASANGLRPVAERPCELQEDDRAGRRDLPEPEGRRDDAQKRNDGEPQRLGRDRLG
jgi:hypothetical protein